MQATRSYSYSEHYAEISRNDSNGKTFPLQEDIGNRINKNSKKKRAHYKRQQRVRIAEENCKSTKLYEVQQGGRAQEKSYSWDEQEPMKRTLGHC